MASKPANEKHGTSPKRKGSTASRSTTRKLFDDLDEPLPSESAAATATDLGTAGEPTSPFSNLVIRASAGTGKTFQLSNRYLALLAHGVPPERILATTFTRKAAGEILDRIIQRLAAAVEKTNERESLAQFLERPDLSRERCLHLLHDLLGNLHRLRIGTLDSLFSQMARSLSLEVGFPPGWRIIDEFEEIAAREASIAAVLGQESTADLLRLAHLLAKGETRRGVGQLVRETVQDLHSLFQETTSEAWHAIAKPKLLKNDTVQTLVEQLKAVTFPNNKMSTACSNDCAQVLAEDWEGFVKSGLAAKILEGETTYSRSPIPDEAIALYTRLLNHARGMIVNRLILQTEGSYELLEKYDQARRVWQQHQGGLRFNDITQQLDHFLRLGAATPESKSLVGRHDALHFRLDGGVSHLLLDEFQDTAPVQWRVLRPFVERAGGGTPGSSFFCVGDVKQAIYGWRGGVAQIFDTVESSVTGVRREQLARSFRSSPAVIDTVNRVCQGLHQHSNLDRCEEAVRSWQNQFEPHTTAKSDLSGYACLRTAKAADEDCDDPILESTAELVEKLTADAPEHDIGVLVRRNETVAGIISALRKKGIEASEEGGNPLSDSAAVQLILSVLQIGDHPSDLVARFHVSQSPLGDYFNFHDHDDDQTARQVSTLVRRFLLQDGYGRTIQSWADAIRPHVGKRDIARLEQLVEQAYLYQSRATLRTGDFIKLVRQKRVADPSRATVRVMTVHQSKGLEFDIVILPELDFNLLGQTPSFVVERPDPTAPVSLVCRYVGAQVRQLLPKDLQQLFERHTTQEVSESLCVLYVALTRAARALYMLIAPSKTNEQTLPRTYAGLLRASLHDGTPVPPGAVLYEYGDREWWKPTKTETTKSSDDVSAVEPPLPKKIKLARVTERRRGLRRVSPSSLEGGRRVQLSKLPDFLSDGAALRGSVFHAWFEGIAWLEDGPVTDDFLAATAERVIREAGGARNVRDWQHEFRDMLANPAIGSLLSRSTYQRKPSSEILVERERPFAVPDSGGLLTGNIDRLVIIRERGRPVAADVIDFKTDQLVGDAKALLKSKVQYYRPQIEAYKRAVAYFTGLEPTKITARLVFVSAGDVVAID